MEKRRFLSVTLSVFALSLFSTAATARTTQEWQESRELFARMAVVHIDVETILKDHCGKTKFEPDRWEPKGQVLVPTYEPGYDREVCGALGKIHYALESMLKSDAAYRKTEQSYVPASIKLLEKSRGEMAVFGELICDVEDRDSPITLLEDAPALEANLPENLREVMTDVCAVLPEWEKIVSEGTAADKERWEKMREEMEDARGAAFAY